MLKDELVEVEVVNTTIRWFINRGYSIPLEKVQLWATNKGKKIKNGVENRVVRGTKIIVAVKDLPPSSNQVIIFICQTCKNEFTTTWSAYRQKQSDNCKSCQAKRGFKGGCQEYWVDLLIVNNEEAKCDISGESDKRFLELHHLLSRSKGGKNEESNYVVLSANYHRAFHRWNGGTNIPCTPKQYYKFKEEEFRKIGK